MIKKSSQDKNVLWKKAGSRPNSKSFLIFGHILILKVSYKCVKSKKKLQ